MTNSRKTFEAFDRSRAPEPLTYLRVSVYKSRGSGACLFDFLARISGWESRRLSLFLSLAELFDTERRVHRVRCTAVVIPEGLYSRDEKTRKQRRAWPTWPCYSQPKHSRIILAGSSSHGAETIYIHGRVFVLTKCAPAGRCFTSERSENDFFSADWLVFFFCFVDWCVCFVCWRKGCGIGDRSVDQSSGTGVAAAMARERSLRFIDFAIFL